MRPNPLAALLATALYLGGCASAPVAAPAAAPAPVPDTVWIESRGVRIPADVATPGPPHAAPWPVVVMAHGLDADRDQDGAFERLAEALAARGIASVRVDFAGFGESTENTAAYDLTSMLADVGSAWRYAADLPNVDPMRSGLVGHGLGARAAMLALEGPRAWAAVALWAPAGTDGPESLLFYAGGQRSWEAARATAAREGRAAVLTPTGRTLPLGERWFEDILRRSPRRALAGYSGPVLVVHGDDDRVIDPAVGAVVAESAIRSVAVRYVPVPDAGNGLGFPRGSPAVRDYVIGTTTAFFETALFAADAHEVEAPETPSP